MPVYAVDREEHKAIYLGRLSNYITWPANTASNNANEYFNLCVLGEDTLKGFLQATYAEKAIKHKPVNIYYVDKVENITDCHLLFISISERTVLAEILAYTNNKPVLTVSEIRGFAEHNGIIQFYMQAQKVKLKINNQAALNHGLKISAKLLAIAKVIE